MVPQEPTVIDWGPCGVRNRTGMCYSLHGGERGKSIPLLTLLIHTEYSADSQNYTIVILPH